MGGTFLIPVELPAISYNYGFVCGSPQTTICQIGERENEREREREREKEMISVTVHVCWSALIVMKHLTSCGTLILLSACVSIHG